MSRLMAILWTLLAAPAAAETAITITDDAGHEVVLAAPASRVVSLAPHVTELLFAAGAGAQVVGVVDYSDYPPAALALPRVGSAVQIDLETILALRPDLVIGWASGTPTGAVEQLRTLGLPVFLSDPRRLSDIPVALRAFGALTGHADEAGAAAGEFEQRLDALRERYEGREPVRLFYQIWDRPLMTVGGPHMISAVLALCGGENVFAGVDELAPRISEEAVLAADPEVIVAGTKGDAATAWLAAWARFPQLAAVRDERLVTADPDTLHRQTPRLLDGAEALCAGLDAVREGR